MKQLVELKSQKESFNKLNTELIFVFREESLGVDGLKKIREKHDPPFTLALDYRKKSSAGYSPTPMTFHNYVIDSQGVIRHVIDGDLRRRAKPAALINALKAIESVGK